MGFFRYHQRNLNKIFIIDYLQKDTNSPGDDLHDRDYAKSMNIMDIQDLLEQMDFTLKKIFKFEDLFFSSNIHLMNKNDLKYNLIFRFDDIIEKSSQGLAEITEYEIKNDKDTLFAKDSLDEIRVRK